MAAPSVRTALALCLLALAAPAARAQVVDTTLWVADGPVHGVARIGNTVYLGGDFTRVGPATGCGVPLDGTSGAAIAPYAKVGGEIDAVVPDGAGGWFIGGTFDMVGGLPRANLAHVLADGSVAPWNPGTDVAVKALALSGTTLYAGGLFTSVGGVTRYGIAALHSGTGAVLPWAPIGDVGVRAIVVSGSTVYVAGDFRYMGGADRNHIAALDAATGLATAWDPNASDPGADVYALALGTGVVYAGGSFATIGGASRSSLAAIDVTTGQATAWDPSPIGNVAAILPLGDAVYVGGYFSYVGGAFRSDLAAIDATTGVAKAWNPSPNDAVAGLARNGLTLYVAGDFTTIAGATRRRLAALDAGSGALAGWSPDANASAECVAAANGIVFAGGSFTSLGGVARKNLAALDASTGAATSWNPSASDIVYGMATSGTTLYVCGAFTTAGGSSRQHVAAFDGNTGALASWNPSADHEVDVLVPNAGLVYAGGYFTHIGGASRNGAAALDAATGSATAWNPNATDGLGAVRAVQAIVPAGGTVYIGGLFDALGAQVRRGIAAVDATTGGALAWGPPDDGLGKHVYALALGGGSLYVGGAFTWMGGVPRANLATLDATTGVLGAWNPGGDAEVRSLVLTSGVLYAGGAFHHIGGQARGGLAAFDDATRTLLAWNQNARNLHDCYVHSIALSGARVYAGGYFDRVGTQARAGVVAVAPSPTLAGVAIASGEAPGASIVALRPNPAAGAVRVDYVVTRREAVRIDVVDVTGREVAVLVDDVVEPGARSLTWDTRSSNERLAAGVYFLRCEVAERSSSRRLVLVH